MLKMRKIITVIVVLVCMTAIGFAQDMGKIAAYKFGQSRAELAVMEKNIRSADQAGYAAIETDLLKILDDPEATDDARQFVCRMLKQVGSDACLPAMEKLLSDKKLSHMARYAIQEMESSEVDKILRNALADVDNNLKVGVISSLGARHDSDSVSKIADLVDSKDLALSEAAISALGRIGGKRAAKVLEKANISSGRLSMLRDDSLLMCADSLVADPGFMGRGKSKAVSIYTDLMAEDKSAAIRIASLRGLVEIKKEKMVDQIVALFDDKDADLKRALPKFIIDMSGENVGGLFADKLPGLSVDTKVVVIDSLAARGDISALAAMKQLTKSENEKVRIAALKSLGSLGMVCCLDSLFEALKEVGPVADAAKGSLGRISGKGVDAMILEKLKNSSGSIKAVLVKVVAERAYRDATPVVLALSEDKDRVVQRAALDALGILSGENDLPSLIGLLSKSSSRSNVERIIQNVCAKNPDQKQRIQVLVDTHNKGLHADDRASVIMIVGRLGGVEALEFVRQQTKDENEKVVDSAVRAIAAWNDPQALWDLSNVAEKTKNELHKILALRGYIRLAGVLAKHDKNEAVDKFDVAMVLVTRDDERRLVVGGLSNIKTAKALNKLNSYLSVASVNTETSLAVVKLSGELDKKRDKKVIVAALTKVVETCKDQKIVEKATSKLKDLGVVLKKKEEPKKEPEVKKAKPEKESNTKVEGSKKKADAVKKNKGIKKGADRPKKNKGQVGEKKKVKQTGEQ